MTALAHPVAFIIRLPLGEGSELISNPVIDPDFDYGAVGSSSISLDVSRRPGRRGCSVVQFPILLDLGHHFPRIRELHLGDVAVHVHPKQCQNALYRLPHFASLESLSIVLVATRFSRGSPITKSLVSLFPHMPRLRSLKVYAPSMRPYVEPDSSLPPYPDPPFSLTKFICVGALAVAACAHIVSCSENTLDELRVNLAFDHEALLVSAIARVAARVRNLDLGLGLRADKIAWPRVRSALAALAHVERIHLETPQTLLDTLDLVGSPVSIRELSLRCTLDLREQSSAPAAEQLGACLLRMPGLRSVTLHGFNIADAQRGALVELCRTRRITCSITN